MTAVQPLLSHERERFVDDLIGYMTIQEKIGQLDLEHSSRDPGLEAAIAGGRVGGVAGGDMPQRLQTLATEHSRLGIPLLLMAPPIAQPISPWALAASWDEELAGQLGALTADTVLRAGANCLAGPRIVIGEDPGSAEAAAVAASEAHLAARLAKAFAARGGDPHLRSAMAIPAIEGAEPAALRCALDLTQGGEVLALDCAAFDRETALSTGRSGLMLAECRRLATILAHHFATTSARSPVEAAERAIADGLVLEHEIDGAVRGVLAVKHACGLFRRGEPTVGGRAANDETASPADMVRRCMVLLRNESGLLPFSPVSDRVLVVGAAEGAGGACADALNRAGIGHAIAPGLALRRGGESWAEPVAGDHFALSLTRDAAQRADFVLVALDRSHFAPRGNGPWLQPGRAVLRMLEALSTVGARLVAVVATDEPVDLAEADQRFSAVLHCWGPRPGFEEALADVLSGRHSPQGRLPVTAGRFEFGQGLGYAECVFSSLALTAGHDHVATSIRVRNTGSFGGRETVQVYVRGTGGELRLVDFKHINLAPGEDVPVRFELGLEALGELDATKRFELTPGPREILVGKNIGRLLTARFDVTPALARAIRRQDLGGLRLAAG